MSFSPYGPQPVLIPPPRGAPENALNRVPQITEFGRIGFKQDELYWPWFLDTSSTGDIAVADTDNNRIQVFNTHTHSVVFPPYGVQGQGTNKGELLAPRSVKYSPIPELHFTVADTGNRRVVLLRINFKSGCLEEVGEFGRTIFREPSDVSCDWRTGNMYVTDTSLNKVTIHNKYGELVSELRPQPQRPFYQPMGVAVDENGRVFVTDMGNNAVKIFDRNGDFIQEIGGLGTGLGQFNRPKGICIDRKGYIYIADEGNSRVQMWSSDLKYMSEIITSTPMPKGVAAHNQLFVTTGDQYNFVKVYNM
ncbi:tripartite motif-containing protein 2 [Lingula anatina]|uniref:Tripartite motif-containing protein 2 n=1 Tax=Lingula anatina TaxID=7574 RepID=A0A1S3IVT9_LINAN|nr:tripartite motif-containing protein 2-like [Lingula anatina]XP_013403204.1 tripartite motif-containing protein 2 [Lingula anatina]|eukprot:XP_013402310.1 tripartite motif-containing protein 2-like [Lingula anatina]